MNNTKSQTHGGKRAGAGRKPKFGERTTLMRIPESAKPMLDEMLGTLADSQRWPDSLTPVRRAENPRAFKVPLFSHTVRAGFPSPADDYVADRLDLNDHLMPRKEASFLLRAKGDSMVGAGIFDGDLLVVDRSITPTNGCIVIATIDGQFTVKRLEKKRGSIRLLAENDQFPPITLKDEQELQVWGVVTSTIHNLKP